MWETESKTGYKVLFWRQSWWGYPKAHQKRKMVPSKPSGVIGEDSDIRGDGIKVRVEVLCRSWAYPHIKPPSVSLAIWSNVGETIVRADREEVDSLLHSVWSTSYLALEFGLSPKQPHIKARRVMIYSPLLSWKNLGSLDLGVKVGPKISLPCIEKVLSHRTPPASF